MYRKWLANRRILLSNHAIAQADHASALDRLSGTGASPYRTRCALCNPSSDIVSPIPKYALPGHCLCLAGFGLTSARCFSIRAGPNGMSSDWVIWRALSALIGRASQYP